MAARGRFCVEALNKALSRYATPQTLIGAGSIVVDKMCGTTLTLIHDGRKLIFATKYRMVQGAQWRASIQGTSQKTEKGEPAWRDLR